MSESNLSNRISEALLTLKTYKERPFVTHQWEELIQQLSKMNDPQLQEIAKREIDSIRKNDDWFMCQNHKQHSPQSKKTI